MTRSRLKPPRPYLPHPPIDAVLSDPSGVGGWGRPTVTQRGYRSTPGPVLRPPGAGRYAAAAAAAPTLRAVVGNDAERTALDRDGCQRASGSSTSVAMVLPIARRILCGLIPWFFAASTRRVRAAFGPSRSAWRKIASMAGDWPPARYTAAAAVVASAGRCCSGAAR